MLLTIEKLIYGGDGLARLPPDERGRGKAVFVPFVLAKEKIDGQIIEQKSGFARARVNRVIEASEHRVAPGCPYFSQCGGCHYQHASYEYQLEIKKEILRENLRRIAKIELDCEIQVHPSPPWNYRNRSRLQIRVEPDFAAGYFKAASHALLPVEQCPISSPLINRGIAALWRMGRKEKAPAGMQAVEFFANDSDTRLLVEIFCSPDAHRSELRSWVENLCAEMPEIAGVTVLREAGSGSGGANAVPLTIGEQHLVYQMQNVQFRVSSGSFFQNNRFMIDELVRVVTDGQTGDFALDLYAGVGLFSTVLAGDFRHIVCVESSQTAAADLSYNLSNNGEAIQATAEQYLAGQEVNVGQDGEAVRTKRLGRTALPEIGQKPDLVVVDPPRGGLGERVARAVAVLGASRIVYVSCDPATLARDSVLLVNAGYKIRRAHLMDLFPQTYHLETVLHFAR